MKIAIIVGTYSKVHGGAERAAHTLVSHLVSQGHEVHLFAHTIHSSGDLSGLMVHSVPTVTFYSPFKHLSFAANVKRLLKRQRFDVIHSFARTYFQDIYRVGGGTHVEYLNHMSRHAGPISRFWARVNPREFANLHLERRSFKELPRQKIVCVSEGVKQEVVNNYGILPERIRVIYNGVDIDRFNPAIRHPSLRDRLGFKQGQILVLFAGSGFKRKGLKFAICAVSRVSNKDARLLVAGRGDPLPYLRLAERLGIAGRIHFLGQQHQIQEIYAISDILLHPTIYDPFPNVCLEAMAMGLPVITTRIAGVSELITHERDGFVVQDAGRLDELVPLLNRLCHDPALRGEIGGQARATAARYTVKRNVESNLALYHEVIKDKSMMY